MKDQYFGDVNDYRKYGLLRAILACASLRLVVCWMLTRADGRTDGRQLAYLDNPAKYRAFDPELFDWLQQSMRQYPDRRTARIESACLLPNAVYFSELLADGHVNRRAWFAGCQRKLEECDLVFFDPDNGLERSVAFGRRHSHKFLYWQEVRDAFSTGASVLVYQHFPREARAAYVGGVAQRLRAESGAAAIFSFRTPHVLFLLAAHAQHADFFREAVRKLPLCWPEKEIAASEVRPEH